MNEIIDHYVDQHTAASPTFPGSGLSWLDSQRKSGISQFKQVGFPGQRDEDWRYTPLRSVTSKLFQIKFDEQLAQTNLDSYLIPGLDCHRLVFIDGQYAAEHSDVSGLTTGVVVDSFEQLLRKSPDAIADTSKGDMSAAHGFAALNIAFSQDGYLVQIPDNAKLDKPVEIIFIAEGDELATQPRNIIRLGKHAEVQIIERYVGVTQGASLVNNTTQISLDQGARLDYYLVQLQQGSAYQVSTIEAELARDSNIASRTITLGGELVRNNLTVNLDQPGAHCDMFGLYNISGKQHVDNHTNVIHGAAHCTSREIYKGVLDQRSRAVFHGRIKVEQDAQKTDATQSNDNILLSANAEIDTKPQLEIYADDVKCAHGATVGQLDQNALFYLRSRGIELQQARMLLTRAFAQDVLGEIAIEPLRDYCESIIARRLNIGDGQK